jgi:hypothetical protein
MGLRHFHPDRAAADHDQVFRRRLSFEDRLVGQEGYVVQAGDGGGRGARSRRQHEAARLDRGTAGLHRIGTGETGAGADHLDTQPLEPLHRVVGGDGRDHAVDMVVDPGEVDLRLMPIDAEAASVAHGLRRFAGCQQRFGRDAAVVEAIAAHGAALDQHGGSSHLDRPGSDRQPAGTGADHTDISLDPGIALIPRPHISRHGHAFPFTLL